jgi:hypothetical protein
MGWRQASRVGLFVLAVGLSAVALAAPSPGLSTGIVKDRSSFIPQRKYAALKGTSVGLLVSDVTAVMSHDGRGGPANAQGFSADNNSYRWMYVPAVGKVLIPRLSVDVGEKPGKKKEYDNLGMANAAEVKRWGITVPYALVEVEVNDGLGAPAQEGFVATKMKRLDGTAKYPLKVPDVVESMRKRYQAHVKDQQKKIDAELVAVQGKILKGRKVTGPRETNELMYMTWLPSSERMRIAFRTRISDGAYQYTGGGVRRGPFPLPPPPRPGQPGATAFRPPPPPIEFKVRFGVTFGVELGMAYEVDRAGKLVATQELLPEGFHQELPPPPAIRRGGLKPIPK